MGGRRQRPPISFDQLKQHVLTKKKSRFVSVHLDGFLERLGLAGLVDDKKTFKRARQGNPGRSGRE